MIQGSWLDVFNAATNFGVLTVIAVAILLLVWLQINNHKSKSSGR